MQHNYNNSVIKEDSCEISKIVPPVNLNFTSISRALEERTGLGSGNWHRAMNSSVNAACALGAIVCPSGRPRGIPGTHGRSVGQLLRVRAAHLTRGS